MFNFIVYTTLTISTLCFVNSASTWALALGGLLICCCSQCFHLAAIILTGLWRYNADGSKCAEKAFGLTAEDEGAMFVDIGNTIGYLFISQCFLYCFYTLWMTYMAFIATMVGWARAEEKFRQDDFYGF